MVLSKRLESILSMIDPCQILLDIGSDHAFLCIEAVKRNIANKAIAADNKKGPLDSATLNINEAQLSKRVFPMLSDGAKSITEECDTWVIAGMGSTTIIEILSQSIEKAQKVQQLIISPHSKEDDVKSFLNKNKFEIISQKIVFDQKFYPIIKARFNPMTQKEKFSTLLFKNFIKDHDYTKWITHQCKHYAKLSKVNSNFKDLYELFSQEFSQNQSQETQ